MKTPLDILKERLDKEQSQLNSIRKGRLNFVVRDFDIRIELLKELIYEMKDNLKL